jgi:hypothetical protein
VKANTLLLLAFLLCGCKSTKVSHTWPDGSKSDITDRRFLHKQEASFIFDKSTNGSYRVSASVTSGADEEAMRAAFDAGIAAGKKIGKAAVVP